MSFRNLSDDNEALRTSYDGQLLVGVVVANVDPLNLDRIKVNVPSLYEGPAEDLPWVMPIKPNIGTGEGPGIGAYGSPAIGADVVILLQNGDPHYPVYLGGLRTKANAYFPSGQSWGFRDAYGNDLKFSQDKSVVIRAVAGVTVTISPTGTVSVTSVADVNISAEGDMNLTAGGDTVIDASRIFLR